jgi:hypothetical protein
MKKVFALLLILFCLRPALKAQDTISMRKGETIIARVLEVSLTEIRYKRFDSPDGPVYIAPKWEVNYVVYANGRKESYESVQAPAPILPAAPLIDLSIQKSGRYYYYKERRISEPDMLAVAKLRKDKKVDLMIKKTEDKRFIQNCFVGAGIGVFVIGGYIYLSNTPARRGRRGSPVSSSTSTTARQNGGYMMLAGLASEVAGITFKLDRTRHAHMVVDLYNKSILQ